MTTVKKKEIGKKISTNEAREKKSRQQQNKI